MQTQVRHVEVQALDLLKSYKTRNGYRAVLITRNYDEYIGVIVLANDHILTNTWKLDGTNSSNNVACLDLMKIWVDKRNT